MDFFQGRPLRNREIFISFESVDSGDVKYRTETFVLNPKKKFNFLCIHPTYQDIADEIKRADKGTLAPSAGIFGKSFHPDADDILNPLIEASRQRAQLDNSCAILAASITCKYFFILYFFYIFLRHWHDIAAYFIHDLRASDILG
jgi:hypothetical protein